VEQSTFNQNIFIVFQWLPTILVLLVGVVLAIVNRKRLRAATGFAIAGFGVIIIGYLASMIFALNQSSIYESFGGDFETANTVVNVVWVGFTLWEALGLGLLIVALLVGRAAPAGRATAVAPAPYPPGPPPSYGPAYGQQFAPSNAPVTAQTPLPGPGQYPPAPTPGPDPYPPAPQSGAGQYPQAPQPGPGQYPAPPPEPYPPAPQPGPGQYPSPPPPA
jgi:hypothetical protein